RKVVGEGGYYHVINFLHGLQMTDLTADPEINTISNIMPENNFPAPVKSDIPDFPSIDTWINLKTLGAVGDGITDDTKAIQEAIDKYPAIYVPSGWYRVSQTIKLK